MSAAFQANAPSDIKQALQERTTSFEKSELLLNFLQTELLPFLKVNQESDIKHHESLFNLGLTSIGSAEFTVKLENAIGVKLNSSTLFNFPTLAQLQMHLLSLLDGSQARQAKNRQPQGSTVMPHEDQVKAMLKRKFGI